VRQCEGSHLRSSGRREIKTEGERFNHVSLKGKCLKGGKGVSNESKIHEEQINKAESMIGRGREWVGKVWEGSEKFEKNRWKKGWSATV